MFHCRVRAFCAASTLLATIGCSDGGETGSDDPSLSVRVDDTTVKEDVDAFVVQALDASATELELDEHHRVDVAVGGRCIVAGLPFLGAAGPEDVPWGKQSVSVYRSLSEPCEADPICTANELDMGDGIETTIVVYGTVDGQLQVAAFHNDHEDAAQVALRHVAAAGPLRFELRADSVESGAFDAGEEIVRELDPGTYDLLVYPEDTEDNGEPLIERVVEVEDGAFIGLFVVGSLAQESLSLLSHDLAP